LRSYEETNISYLDFVTRGFKKELQGILQSTHWIQSEKDFINVYVNIGEEMLKVNFSKKRISTARVHIFLGWVIFSSAILNFYFFSFFKKSN
jgi:hypothetical protein